MKPAAEDATEILMHYLRHAGSSVDLDDPDVFAEIKDAMQGLIDEAGAAQKEYRTATAKLFLRHRGDIEKLRIEVAALKRELATHKLPPDWTYSPPVEPPLGPMCIRPEPPLRQGKSEQAPKIAGVVQLLPGPSCLKQGEETEHLPSDRLSHVYNCKFCEQILMERGE